MSRDKIFILILLACFLSRCGSVLNETDRIASKFNAASPGSAGSATNPAPVGNIVGTAVWARTTAASPVSCGFNAVAADSSGNVYAAGYQNNNGTYTYGTQSIVGGASLAGNCVIVKYLPDGTAQWAMTNTTGANGCRIYGLALDTSGNIYAAGSFNAALTYTFGGVPKVGVVGNFNALLLKLDTSGNVQWIRSTSAGIAAAEFNAVAVDGAGNIYAAGYQTLATTNTYDGATATSAYAGGNNALLVKYDTNGIGQWGRSVSAGATAASTFQGVATDSSGNVYAAGAQSNTGNFTYSGLTIAGSSATTNAVIVKYSGAGSGLWARTVSAGTAGSQFLGIAAESGGGIFAVGSKAGNSALTFGAQVVTGTYAGGNNALAVKYDNSGNAIWARSVTVGANASSFAAAAADTNGNMYAAGVQTGSAPYTYSGQSVSASNAGANVALVKYDAAGNGVWARSASPAPGVSSYSALAVLNTDFLFAAGQQTGTGTFTHATQSVAGAGTGANALLVKYK